MSHEDGANVMRKEKSTSTPACYLNEVGSELGQKNGKGMSKVRITVTSRAEEKRGNYSRRKGLIFVKDPQIDPT